MKQPYSSPAVRSAIEELIAWQEIDCGADKLWSIESSPTEKVIYLRMSLGDAKQSVSISTTALMALDPSIREFPLRRAVQNIALELSSLEKEGCFDG